LLTDSLFLGIFLDHPLSPPLTPSAARRISAHLPAREECAQDRPKYVREQRFNLTGHCETGSVGEILSLDAAWFQ
jgi:hypothetical protein